MAQVDASIPLRAIGGQGGMTTAEAFSLADFAEERQQRREERPYRMEALRAQSQQNAMSLQQMQLNLKKAQGVLKIAQTPGMMDDDGAPTAEGVKAGMSLDPMEIGPAWAKQRREASKAKTEETYKKLEAMAIQGQLDDKFVKSVKENQTELAKVYKSSREKAISNHDATPHDTAVAMVQKEAERRHKAGLLNDAQYQKVISTPWDNDMADGIIAAGEPTKTPSEYEDIIKRQKGLSTTSPEWKQLEERRKYLTEHPAPIALFQTPEGGGVSVEGRHGQAPLVKQFDLPKSGVSKIGQGQLASSPEQIQSYGAMVKSGMPLTQVVPGWGPASRQKQQQTQMEAIRQLKEENPGMTDVQAGQALADANIDFAAGKKSVGQLTTQYNANTVFVKQLEFNVQKATEILKTIPSSDLSPIFNAMARGEQKWTGDPQYKALYYYIYGASMEAQKLIQGGAASVAALHAGVAEDAKRFANENDTPRSLMEGVFPAMIAEGKNRLQIYEGAIKRAHPSAPKTDPISGAVTKPYTGDSGKTPGDIQDLLDKYNKKK
jgi:hypothetical protein